LGLVVNNKAEFILQYNEHCEDNLKKEDVDWSQSRVIFVSPQFSKYQQKAMHFKDLAFELWEIKKYENKIISLNQLKSPETSESIDKVSQKSKIAQKVTKEVKVYTEEDHFKMGSEKTTELYQELKTTVLNLGNDIEIKPRKLYIGFKRGTNFMDVEMQKSKLKVFINLKSGELNDPQNKARDLTKPKIGHWGNGDYEVILSNSEEIPYLLTLVKQGYERNS